MMTDPRQPSSPLSTSERRKQLAPDVNDAFVLFSKMVFANGALSSKMKQIVAVAVAHVTQCQFCINGHTKAALRAGATPEELMEAIWVAAEMRAGGAFAHSALMLAALDEEEAKRQQRAPAPHPS